MKLRERVNLILTSLLKGLLIVLAEHLPIFIILVIYLGYGLYIDYKLINYDVIQLRFAMAQFVSLLILYNFLLFFIGQFGLRVFKDNIEGLYPKLQDIIKNYFSLNRFAGFILIYALLPVVISIFESLKKAIPLVKPFHWDTFLMELDYLIHFNNHPWTLFSPILANTIAIRLIDILYITWFWLLNIITFWLAWSNRRKLRMQFFTTNLLILFLIGNLLATVFSSAGPCYYEIVTGVSQQNPYTPLLDKLHSIEDDSLPADRPHPVNDNSPIIALELQDKLWDNYIHNASAYCEYISAMPSVHVAFATLFALTVMRVNIYFGIIFWIYWAIIQLGSVILGWHYAVDGYFSTILTIGLWKICGYFNEWFWRELPEEIRIQIFKPNLKSLQNKSL
jgi:hypothetical protein